MDGLEPADVFFDILDQVPHSVGWAECHTRPDGLVEVLLARPDPTAELFFDHPSSDPFAVSALLPVGVLDPERLRIGVRRILSGLVPVSSEAYFILRASEPGELPPFVVDVIVQASLFGAIVY